VLCWLCGALSEIANVPKRAPGTLGVKVMLTVQLAPAGRLRHRAECLRQFPGFVCLLSFTERDSFSLHPLH
jgi:hypothetical protein